jgi:hypothetical protein
VREAVTSGLEIMGLFLVAAALALYVSRWTVPGALGAAAVILLAAAALFEVRTPEPAGPADRDSLE